LVKPDTLDTYDPVFASAKRSGLAIPEFAERQERSAVDTGVVVQIGPTAVKDFGGDPWCKVGDKISYTRHGGKFVTNPDDPEEKWLVLNDEDVVMVSETK